MIDSKSKSTRKRVVMSCMALNLAALMAPITARVAYAGPPDSPAKRSPLLAAMQTELDRSFKVLSSQDPPAYYIGYTITDYAASECVGFERRVAQSSERKSQSMAGSFGAHGLLRSRQYA